MSARRTFLLGGVAAVGVVTLSAYGVCSRRDARTADLERLRVAMPDIPFPERISADPQLARPKDEMIDALLEDRQILSALEISCPATRRAFLRQYAKEEFKSGRYCVAGRMVVSRSEHLIATYFSSTV